MRLDDLRAKNLTIHELQLLAATLRTYRHREAALLVEEEIEARRVQAAVAERLTWANHTCRLPIERVHASAV